MWVSSDYDKLEYPTLDLLLSPLRKSNVLDDWCPREIALFEAGICAVGKDFHAISNLVCAQTRQTTVRAHRISRGVPGRWFSHSASLHLSLSSLVPLTPLPSVCLCPDFLQELQGVCGFLLHLEEVEPLCSLEASRETIQETASKQGGTVETNQGTDERRSRGKCSGEWKWRCSGHGRNEGGTEEQWEREEGGMKRQRRPTTSDSHLTPHLALASLARSRTAATRALFSLLALSLAQPCVSLARDRLKSNVTLRCANSISSSPSRALEVYHSEPWLRNQARRLFGMGRVKTRETDRRAAQRCRWDGVGGQKICPCTSRAL